MPKPYEGLKCCGEKHVWQEPEVTDDDLVCDCGETKLPMLEISIPGFCRIANCHPSPNFDDRFRAAHQFAVGRYFFGIQNALNGSLDSLYDALAQTAKEITEQSKAE